MWQKLKTLYVMSLSFGDFTLSQFAERNLEMNAKVAT